MTDKLAKIVPETVESIKQGTKNIGSFDPIPSMPGMQGKYNFLDNVRPNKDYKFTPTQKANQEFYRKQEALGKQENERIMSQKIDEIKPSKDQEINKGEGTGNVKPVQQINNRFPNDIQTGKEFSFNIENGYLKNTNGLTEVDFVVDMKGKLHIGRGHSFLANGESVQSAGKLNLNGQGQVRSISNLSGHYTPSVEQAKLFPQILEQAGVKTKNAWLEIYTIETTPSGYVNTNELVKISSTQIK